MDLKEGLSYNDITIVPKYSEILSRHSVSLKTRFGDGISPLQIPVIAAPMDTVCEVDTAICMSSLGGIGVLHRYADMSTRLKWVKKIHDAGQRCVVAIGTSDEEFQNLRTFHDAGIRIFCIDVAHGDHILVKDMIEKIKVMYGNGVHIMAGNVATYDSTKNLIQWGVDSIRVGVGGGAVCSTRIVTGHGVPNVTAIQEAKRAKKELESNVVLIADGGIKSSGDAVKAFAVGADIVMLGSLLSGTDETPGEVLISPDGKHFKAYRGMASAEAQEEWRNEVSVEEGVSRRTPYKGSLKSVIDNFTKGIRSGVSYSGCPDLDAFKESAEVMKQTPSAYLEGTPHHGN